MSRQSQRYADRRSGRMADKFRRLTQPYLFKEKERGYDDVPPIDLIYDTVVNQLMYYQNPITGLFPRYSSETADGYVRDSIYCAMALWATSMAFRRLDDDRGRQHEMRCTAVKTMRGILQCWMLQTPQLEAFKRDQDARNALHSKFALATGKPVVDADKYNHLQLDVICLYLLVLVQMTASDVQIIWEQAEVSFVQNLVFYIERAYRTPDFGMWECGTRYNDGNPELHASTLGFAKAALEAINGFNVYGSKGTTWSVIYVDIDAHNRNRTTFEMMLPRESGSKNTDAALIPTIGWPCYSTHDESLAVKTKEKVLRRLEGKYGFKRFLRDGFRTVLESPDRRFYDKHETVNFEKIESEWPIFYLFLYIEAMLASDEKTAEKYWQKLFNDEQQNLMTIDRHEVFLGSVPSLNAQSVVPECWYVPAERIPFERAQPGSEAREPVSAIEEGHFLWAQALHIIARLLREKLLHPNELDPIYRHLPASQRPTSHNRHSAFQLDHHFNADDLNGHYRQKKLCMMVNKDRDGYQGGDHGADPVAQIALIAESKRLQSHLNTYGIHTQTPSEVEPVKIWPSGRLVKVFERLGACAPLGLTGRPSRPFGVLSTCKVYRIFGETVLCYPLTFEMSDFYSTADPAVLIENIKNDLRFVAHRWKLAGRPTFCVVLRDDTIWGGRYHRSHFDAILELLVALKNGYVNGVRVRVGRVQNLLGAGCLEHIDFVRKGEQLEFESLPLFQEAIVNEGEQFVSLHDLKAGTDDDDIVMPQTMIKDRPTNELLDMYKNTTESFLRMKALILAAIWRNEHPEFMVDELSVRERLQRVYRSAEMLKSWWVVRYCAGLLRKVVDSLAPSVTTVMVRGKRITFGMRGSGREKLIDRPMPPAEIIRLLNESSTEDDPIPRVFQQEVLTACAHLIGHQPSLFDGILSIRLGWLMEAMEIVLSKSTRAYHEFVNKHTKPDEKASMLLYELAPSKVRDIIEKILNNEYHSDLGPLEQRRLNGAISRMPVRFHDRMWKVMEKCHGGITIADYFQPQQPLLSDMTQFELAFEQKFESMLCLIQHPEYRQIMLEALLILSMVLERNPECYFQSMVNMDELIHRGFHMFTAARGLTDTNDLTHFYTLPFHPDGQSPCSTAVYLTKAVVEALLNNEQALSTSNQQCIMS